MLAASLDFDALSFCRAASARSLQRTSAAFSAKLLPQVDRFRRMVSRTLPSAGAAHCSPLLPSTTAPSSARNPKAAFRLGRLVPWPHSDSWRRRALRLTGPLEPRSAARIYSKVSRVGLAPRLANSGPGGVSSICMPALDKGGMYTYCGGVCECTPAQVG